MEKGQQVTAVWRNGGCSASYDSFVVGSSAVLRLNFCAKIRHYAKPPTVSGNFTRQDKIYTEFKMDEIELKIAKDFLEKISILTNEELLDLVRKKNQFNKNRMNQVLEEAKSRHIFNEAIKIYNEVDSQTTIKPTIVETKSDTSIASKPKQTNNDNTKKSNTPVIIFVVISLILVKVIFFNKKDEPQIQTVSSNPNWSESITPVNSDNENKVSKIQLTQEQLDIFKEFQNNWAKKQVKESSKYYSSYSIDDNYNITFMLGKSPSEKGATLSNHIKTNVPILTQDYKEKLSALNFNTPDIVIDLELWGGKEYNERRKARFNTIEFQFDPRTNEHFELAEKIKEQLKDPDSYEHIKTTYKDNGNSLDVKTTIRAKNSFGAYDVATYHAEIYIDSLGEPIGFRLIE